MDRSLEDQGDARPSDTMSNLRTPLHRKQARNHHETAMFARTIDRGATRVSMSVCEGLKLSNTRQALAGKGRSTPKEFGMMYQLLLDAMSRTFSGTPNSLLRAFNIAWSRKTLPQDKVVIPLSWKEEARQTQDMLVG